jgi:hypothetical protein
VSGKYAEETDAIEVKTVHEPMYICKLHGTSKGLLMGLPHAIQKQCRSQWSRGLRRGSAAARLLRSWVRIPPEGHRCLSVVSVLCCQVKVSATR